MLRSSHYETEEFRISNPNYRTCTGRIDLLAGICHKRSGFLNTRFDLADRSLGAMDFRFYPVAKDASKPCEYQDWYGEINVDWFCIGRITFWLVLFAKLHC